MLEWSSLFVGYNSLLGGDLVQVQPSPKVFAVTDTFQGNNILFVNQSSEISKTLSFLHTTKNEKKMLKIGKMS